MRDIASPQWDRWRSATYEGDHTVLGFVTVEPYWQDRLSSHTNALNDQTLGTYSSGPVRWWQRADNSQYERVVPNVRSANWDRHRRQPVGNATITIANTRGPTFDPADPVQVAFADDPGHYSPDRGGPQKRPPQSGRVRPWVPGVDGWGRIPNEWAGVLAAGSVFRIYEGYGDPTKTFEEARADGDVHLTATVRADRCAPHPRTGDLVLTCRSMLGIAADTPVMSNESGGIVPRDLYPLRYARWSYTRGLVRKNTTVDVKVRGAYATSSNDKWYPSRIVAGRGAPQHGHYPADVLDTTPGTFWLSEGHSHPSRPFSAPWIELDYKGQDVTSVSLSMFGGGGYDVYISVKEGGVWKGAKTVPYDHTPLIGEQPHVVDTGADIPYVKRVQLGPAANIGVGIPLGRTYKAQRVRITLRNLPRSQWAPAAQPYRGGLYSVKALNRFVRPGYEWGEVVKDGNLTDWLDAVRDLMLWTGWWLLPEADGNGDHKAIGTPKVFGELESTGTYPEEPPPADFWDKQYVLDIVAKIADIVGYHLGEGPDGGIRFITPNWWEPGNYVDGKPVDFMPHLHDAELLLDHSPTTSIESLRSTIIISTEEPTLHLDGTVVSRYWPDFRGELRGTPRPAQWVNGTFLNPDDQANMAELAAMLMFVASREAPARCPGIALLDVDDQVRVLERVSATNDIHYIAGISSTHDFEKRTWTYDLDLNWLGTRDRWAWKMPGSQTKEAWQARRRYRTEPNESWARIMRRAVGDYYQPHDQSPETFNLHTIKAMNVDKFTTEELNAGYYDPVLPAGVEIDL